MDVTAQPLLDGIEAVIFDKDGTLFDFTATWGRFAGDFIEAEMPDAAGRAALSDALGFDLPSRTFYPDSIVIAGTSDEVARRVAGYFPQESLASLRARMNVAAAQVPQVPVLALPAFLEQLKSAGLRLGLATNDAESSALAHLTRESIDTHFDFIAGYDSGHGGKPAPGQLLAFAQAVNVAPQACAMVGDSLHDLHAARAAGMVAVAVLTGVAGRADLAPAADIVLGSIADLPAALGIDAG